MYLATIHNKGYVICVQRRIGSHICVRRPPEEALDASLSLRRLEKTLIILIIYARWSESLLGRLCPMATSYGEAKYIVHGQMRGDLCVCERGRNRKIYDILRPSNFPDQMGSLGVFLHVAVQVKIENPANPVPCKKTTLHEMTKFITLFRFSKNWYKTNGASTSEIIRTILVSAQGHCRFGP